MSDSPSKPLEKELSHALLKEHRSSRRWKNFRFFVWILLILFVILFSAFSSHTVKSSNKNDKPYVSLIRLNGVIMPSTDFSARKVIPQLNRAFKDKEARGVVLLINSPGGSPVQSSIIHDKIVQLKKRYHKKVIVVAEDTLASGAYLVATAADRIYVNDDTLTGSIGVIMSSFGFKDAIAKLGVTRRVFTAGANKDRLDPFKSMTAADKEKIQQILQEVHQHFIDDVMVGRHDKLHGDLKEIFSGDFWTGSTAVKLGLADGTANLWTAMQKNFGTTYYRNYSPRRPFWEVITRDLSTSMRLALPHEKTELDARL